MAFYPKPLQGPSALGASQARALALRGGDYQWSQRDSNTVVKKQGDFSRVLVSGAEYTSSGRKKAGGDRVAVETQRYLMPFRPSFATPSYINTGDGEYMGTTYDMEPPITVTVTPYQVHPAIPEGPNGIYSYRCNERNNSVAVVGGSYYGGGFEIGFFPFAQTLTGSFLVTFYLFANTPPIVFAREIAGPPRDKRAFVPFLYNDGRQDSRGRMLPDVVFSMWPRNQGDPQSIALNTAAFTRADAEFSALMTAFQTPLYTGCLVAEQFFFPGAVDLDAPDDTRPKLWVITSAGDSLSSVNAFDVTSILFAGAKLPTPVQFPPLVGEYFTPHAGDDYNVRQTFTMASMVCVTLPGNVVLATFSLYCAVAGQEGWRLRIARLVMNGGPISASLQHDEYTGVSGALSIIGYFIQSIVHLGEGWVLAKRVNGFPGTGHSVDFLLSTDGGITWAPFAPAGFDVAMQNQFFGGFIVHASRRDGEHGTVLMNAWSNEKQATFVYESKDSGLSWSRKGMVAKPDAFYRIDSMLSGDGGGNFETLTPGPNPLRAVDLTLPSRYGP